MADRGRPTDYSWEVVAPILERLADGESLRSICREDAMPSKASIFLWLSKYPDFSDQYAKAREAQADSHADDIVDIADDPNLKTDPVLVQIAKLRIDTRKWAASKLKSKAYGDKVQQEHTGPGGSALPTVITLNVVRPDGTA